MTKRKQTESSKDSVAFEIPAIRLSVDESRAIFKASQASGPIESYASRSLVELGIMKAAKITSKKADNESASWAKLKAAVSAADLPMAKRALDSIYTARAEKGRTGYILTELGKQVARGISVRMAAQFR